MLWWLQIMMSGYKPLVMHDDLFIPDYSTGDRSSDQRNVTTMLYKEVLMAVQATSSQPNMLWKGNCTYSCHVFLFFMFLYNYCPFRINLYSYLVLFHRKIHTLIGHRGEISSAQFNYDCSLIVTGSMDKTCKIWDTGSGKCIGTLRGHDDEILDVVFDYTGQYIASASADSKYM